VDAAEIATAVPSDKLTAETMRTITSHWQIALRDSTESSSDISQRFLAAYQPLLGNELAAQQFPLLLALLVDRDALGQVSVSDVEAGSDPFAASLLAYRQRGTESDALISPPPGLIADATLRLMRDGRQNPVLRQSIAQLLGRWEGNDDRSLGHAERLIWSGQMRQAVSIIDEMMRAQPADADFAKQGARLLETTGDAQALIEAVRIWDQLAGGTTQGTALWHEAKLAGIAALRRAGNLSEAQRRARYVLLTSPRMEESFRVQYESFAK
jgi:hypothetical protein